MRTRYLGCWPCLRLLIGQLTLILCSDWLMLNNGPYLSSVTDDTIQSVWCDPIKEDLHRKLGTFILLIIEREGWRWHFSLIFLILLFTKPNIEVSGWLYQTKTHFTHFVYQPFSRVSPPSFTLYGVRAVWKAIKPLKTFVVTQPPRSFHHVWKL